MKVLALVVSFFSLNIMACDGGLTSKLISIPEKSIMANDMTQEQFKQAFKDFEKFWAPVVEREHNAELQLYGSWTTNTVNAFAERSGEKFMITVYGGLARHPAITMDGLTASLCHELGHHLGGYPKKATNTWSSAEGQADYYATMKCLRRFWEKADNAAAISQVEIPVIVKSECAQTFSREKDQVLCQRMSMAGKSVALMIQALDWDSIEPKFDTPDTTVVRAINYMHPYAQCRLDTFFQGSICGASEMVEFDNDYETKGACHPKNGDTRGNRPKCWFVAR